MISDEDLQFARKCIEKALRNNGRNLSADAVASLQPGEISVVADGHGGGRTDPTPHVFRE